MNYPESTEILQLIDKSRKILLNCHRNPDSDSVGSSTTLAKYLMSLNKEVRIISPSEIPENLNYLSEGMPITVSDFDSFDFKGWDLLIMTDTSSWDRVFSSTEITQPDIKTVVIDNHETNKKFGSLNLIDLETSSVCEQIYKLFEDWNVSITKDIAQALLSGIEGDTGSFQFEVHSRTFEIAQKLVSLGADMSFINFHLFNSLPLEIVKVWGLVIKNLTIDEDGIAYSAIPLSEYAPFQHIKGGRETAATMIIRKIANTKIGFIFVEDEPKTFSVSFRNREKVDVAKIASLLGGGGHSGASGATIHVDTFEEGLKIVLDACREVLHNK